MENELQKIDNKNDIMPINAGELIKLGISNNLSVDTMERLLAMRRELKAEQAREQFFFALANFQKECPLIEKKKKVYEKNSKKVRYCYAPLSDIISQVKDVLLKHGFSYIIKTTQEKGNVTAICEAHHVSGHFEQTSFNIPIEPGAYMNAAQKVASALTFAKRYAFCNAFGIMSGEDDDDSIITEEPVNRQQQEVKIKPKAKPMPEENQAIYQASLVLLQESAGKQSLFTNNEMIKFKKSLDSIKYNINDLKNLYQVLKKTADGRRKNIKEGQQGT